VTTKTLSVLGIDNVLLTVGDLDDAVDFYAERIGLQLAFRLDDRGIALFRLGPETPGLLAQRGAPGTPRNGTALTGATRVWLEVADARAAARTLAAAGLPILADPFEVATGWTVEISDPWGNVIGFTDYTRMPERARTANAGP
jgi:predicted enzyme related to lactoylglutathione lyase